MSNRTANGNLTAEAIKRGNFDRYEYTSGIGGKPWSIVIFWSQPTLHYVVEFFYNDARKEIRFASKNLATAYRVFNFWKFGAIDCYYNGRTVKSLRHRTF